MSELRQMQALKQFKQDSCYFLIGLCLTSPINCVFSPPHSWCARAMGVLQQPKDETNFDA